jgi:hypothetical protein
MTEQQLEILDQLIETGYATRTVGILNNAVQVTFHTLTAEQQMLVEAQMKDVTGTPLHGLHTYSVKLLAQSLVDFSYKGVAIKFLSADEAETFVRSKPTTLVDLLVTEQSKLEKEVNELITGKTTVEDFSKTPPADSEPK